jgi:hypothetical protein
MTTALLALAALAMALCLFGIGALISASDDWKKGHENDHE